MTERKKLFFNITSLDPTLYDTRETFFEGGRPEVAPGIPEGLRTSGGTDYSVRKDPEPAKPVFERPAKRTDSPMTFPNKRGTPTDRKGRKR